MDVGSECPTAMWVLLITCRQWCSSKDLHKLECRYWSPDGKVHKLVSIKGVHVFPWTIRTFRLGDLFIAAKPSEHLSSTVNAMHTSILHPLAARFSHACAVHASLQIIGHITNIVTGPPLRATHARNRLPPLIKPPREIRKHHITHQHVRGPSRSPIIATILRDNTPILCPPHIKVTENQITHISPAASARQVVGFVIAVSTRDELAYPRLDIDGVADVVLGAAFDYRGVVDFDVGHAGVFEVLAEGADGDAVAADAGYVFGGDGVAAGFDRDAVIAALVEEVCEEDIAGVHCVCDGWLVPQFGSRLIKSSRDSLNPSVF